PAAVVATAAAPETSGGPATPAAPAGEGKPRSHRQRPRRGKGGEKPANTDQPARPPRQPVYDPNSPFAVLAKLRFGNSGR
ncbi:hypothetical protein, partial [Thalassobaculum sp.]